MPELADSPVDTEPAGGDQPPARSRVLQGIRSKYPQYESLSDADLALKIGRKFPVYLEKDPDFKAEFSQAVADRSVKPPPKRLTPQEAAALARAPGTTTPGDLGPYSGSFPGPIRQERDQEAAAIVRAPSRIIGDISEDVSGMASDFLRRTGIDPSAEPGRNTIDLPTVPQEQLKNSPLAVRMANVAHAKAAKFISGFTEPGQAALLPLASQKAIQAFFLAGATGNLPEGFEQLGQAKTPEEIESAAIGLGLDVTLAAAIAKHMQSSPLAKASDKMPASAPLTKAALKQQALTGADLATPKGATPTVKPKAGKPTVPFSLAGTEPEPGAAPKAEDPKPELSSWDDFVGDLAKRGTGNETIAQIQAMYPDQKINRESARRLGEAAFGEKWKRTEQNPPKIPQDASEPKPAASASPATETPPAPASDAQAKPSPEASAPTKPEQIVSAAYIPEGATEPVTGPNHPAILEKLGVDGFESRESRNTPQFGYVTSTGRFVGREEGGKIAEASGQKLEDYEGGQAHSNEISAKPDSDKPLSETSQPVREPATPSAAGPNVQSETVVTPGGTPAPVEPGKIPGNIVLTPVLKVGKARLEGRSHLEAAKSAPDALRVDALIAFSDDANHIFKDQNGKEYTREEAAKVFDEQRGNPPGKTKSLHSEDLRDAGLLGHLTDKELKALKKRLDKIGQDLAKPRAETKPVDPPKRFSLRTEPNGVDGTIESESGSMTVRATTTEEPDGTHSVDSLMVFVPPGILDARIAPRVTVDLAEKITGKTKEEARQKAYQALTNEINNGNFDALISKGEPKQLPAPVAPEVKPTVAKKVGEPNAFLDQLRDDQSGKNSPKRTKLYQQLGTQVVPGIRLQDAEEAGRLWEMVAKGEATPDEWNKWVEEAVASNRVAKGSAAPEQPPPSDVGPGMGGAIPSEFEHSPVTATGIRNAVVDQERAQRGLPPAVQPLRRAFGAVWDQAMAAIDHDPGVVDRLIDELRDKPRALTDLEDAMVLHRQVDLQNEYGKATRDLAQAYDDGRTDAVMAEKLRTAALSDRLLDLYNIGKRVGTETGRGLAARKMMAYEDFSLAHMELEKRSANGGRPLTDAEREEITRLHEQVAATQKAYDEYVARTDARIAQMESEKAHAQLVAQAEKEKAPSPVIVKLAEKIVAQLDAKADAARARIRARMGTVSSGVDPTILIDLSEIGAAHIGHIGLDFVKWSAKMVSDMGEWVKPHLEEVFKASQTNLDKLADKMAGKDSEETKRKVKNQTPEDERADLVDRVRQAGEKGERNKITFYAQRLARGFVKAGIKEREPLIDAVHEVLQEALPDMTRREAMDAISGYGDFRQLSKDRISVELRGMKGEMQQLAKLEDMAAGQPPLKTGMERRTPTDAERKLIKAVNDAKLRFQVPVSDPSTQLKSALDTLKTTLANRIADYEDRLARKDFAARPRRQVLLDAEAQRLKSENERVKKKWRSALTADRLKNRNRWEKVLDWGTKYRRFEVLSSPIVLPKLLSAGAQRLASLPIEDLVGSGLRRIPGVSGVFSKAPLEGAGANLKAEMRGYGAAFTKGMKDAYDVMKTGHSELDVLYGKAGETYTGEADLGSAWLTLPGRIHGMIKAPVKRAVFERSVQRLGEFYGVHDLDVADPVVKARILTDAYKAANAAIFLQDNMLASKVSGFFSEHMDKSTGHATPGSKALATTGRVLLPIVRVPMNIVAETMQYAGGLASGSVRLANALRKGAENLTPEQADLIARELKKGSVGAAVMALGYFNSNAIGGYYQPGKKKKSGDVPYGNIRVYGHDIPSWLLHNPLLETLQVGATLRRVADSKLRKKDREVQGLSEGAMAAALGAVEQVPFVRESTELEKLRNPYTRDQFLGDQAKSFAVPAIVQRAAEWTDRDAAGNLVKRRPKTVGDSVKSGLPGLRQQVPRDKRPALVP